MVPLEAQACGRPVIAFGAGGSLETVRGSGPSPTGVYFRQQTAASLAAGILAFESAESTFSPAAAHAWAESFRTEVFLARMRAHILTVLPAAAAAMSPPPDTSGASAAQ